MADHKTEHLPGAGASLHHYVRGLILSVLLTGAAFALVMTGALPRNATIFVILALAAVQIFVHMVDFLHIDGNHGDTASCFDIKKFGAMVRVGGILCFDDIGWAAAAYALYLFFSGEFVQRIGSLRLVGLASTVASVCCIVHFGVANPLGAARVAEPVLWLSLLNATLCTAMPVLLVMLGVERIGASLAAQVGMIGPLSTIAMGIVLLGEPLTPWLVAGTLLVMAGIALFGRAGRAASIEAKGA